MTTIRALLIRQLIASVLLFHTTAQNSGNFSGQNDSGKGINISTVVNGPMASSRSVPTAVTPGTLNNAQKASVPNSALKTYSIARSPLLPSSVGIAPLRSHSIGLTSFSNPEPEPEVMSSLNFHPTTPAAPGYGAVFVEQSITTAKSAGHLVSGTALSLPETTKIPLLRLHNSPVSKLELIPVNANGSVTTPSHQGNTFEDDAEQISEEQFNSNVDTAKPDAVDNEAIEELVNHFLNSDLIENGKKQKLNKEALKLINSSRYWNTDSLQPEGSIKGDIEAQEWMNGYVVEAEKVLREVASAGWNYVTSVSHLTKQLLDEAEEVLAKFVKASSKQAKQFDTAAIKDPSLKRQFQLLLVEGISALDEDDFDEYNEIQKLIGKSYAETSVCDTDRAATICPYRVSDIASVIAHENDAARALRFWIAWRDALGPKLVAAYGRLFQLINKGAALNGFSDGGAMWRSPYDLLVYQEAKRNGDIVDVLQHLYQKISPFYKQLHAYVRRQIAAVFRPGNVDGLTQDGPIPAHLLKSIAGDNWLAFYPDTKPFQEEDDLAKEVQENLQKQNYTAKNMFRLVYKNLRRLGFGKLPTNFWSKSAFTRTWSKDMLCQPPAAYDMRNGSDYRVKLCAQLSLPDFELAHKLLIHIYYYYLYRDQPLLFREPTNPSFLTALTNAFAINARNVEYLNMMKLVEPKTNASHSRIINRLYLEALEEFVRLPFDVAADTWRFHVFDGTATNATWNTDWWQLMKNDWATTFCSELFQGIKPPVERKPTDFDAIASSTVAQIHAPAMKHFFAYIMQFQILKALCPETPNLSSGCVIQPDTTVIDNIKKVMALGSSITWREALQIITGSEELDTSGILEYFQPLISWLEIMNKRENAFIGWDGPGRRFTEAQIPKLRGNITDSDSFSGILSGNQFAFPGGDCSIGRECLLDSVCKNGVCECKEGLYTLRIGSTYNCVPDNPANAGFGDGHGGLIIGLHPADGSETLPTPEPEQVTKPWAELEPGIKNESPSSSAKPEPEPKEASAVTFIFSLLLLHVSLIALL